MPQVVEPERRQPGLFQCLAKLVTDVVGRVCDQSAFDAFALLNDEFREDDAPGAVFRLW